MYITAYQKDLRDRKINQNLKFQKIVKTAILIDSTKIDTLFIDKNKPPLHLLGDIFTLNEGHKVSSSLWLTDHSTFRRINNKSQEVIFDLQFETEDRMNIDGWETIVLGRMATLSINFILKLQFLIF